MFGTARNGLRAGEVACAKLHGPRSTRTTQKGWDGSNGKLESEIRAASAEARSGRGDEAQSLWKTDPPYVGGYDCAIDLRVSDPAGEPMPGGFGPQWQTAAPARRTPSPRLAETTQAVVVASSQRTFCLLVLRAASNNCRTVDHLIDWPSCKRSKRQCKLFFQKLFKGGFNNQSLAWTFMKTAADSLFGTSLPQASSARRKGPPG